VAGSRPRASMVSFVGAARHGTERPPSTRTGMHGWGELRRLKRGRTRSTCVAARDRKNSTAVDPLPGWQPPQPRNSQLRSSRRTPGAAGMGFTVHGFLEHEGLARSVVAILLMTTVGCLTYTWGYYEVGASGPEATRGRAIRADCRRLGPTGRGCPRHRFSSASLAAGHLLVAPPSRAGPPPGAADNPTAPDPPPLLACRASATRTASSTSLRGTAAQQRRPVPTQPRPSGPSQQPGRPPQQQQH
jgi:hypothetical protein